MEKLPVEMILKIFEYLDFESVLKMRGQSRLFNEIVRLMTFRELSFHEPRLIFPVEDDQTPIDMTTERMFALKGNWFYINRPIVFHNPVALGRLHLLFKNVINLNALRRLRIRSDPMYSNRWVKLPTHQLNQLRQLEHLDLDLTCMQPNHEQQHLLILPNLVALHVHQSPRMYSVHSEINLVVKGSAKLRGLSVIGHFDHCQIQPSHSVTHLRSLAYHERISTFKNLSYFECHFMPPKDLLDLLPRLKELRVNNGDLSHFVRQKNELGRTQLRIFGYGVELTNGDELSNDKLLERARHYLLLKYYAMDGWTSFSHKGIASDLLEQFYLTHYTRLASRLEEANTLEFGALLTAFRSLIPCDLSEKFSNIKSLVIGRLLGETIPFHLNESQLIELIANCRNLCSFSVLSSSHPLPQTFWDQLPERSALFVLIVRQRPTFRLNFKFLNRMQQLWRLETDQMIIADELEPDSLKNLGHFEFLGEKMPLKIKRATVEEPFRLYRNGQELFRAGKFSQTIHWLSGQVKFGTSSGNFGGSGDRI